MITAVRAFGGDVEDLKKILSIETQMLVFYEGKNGGDKT
jgi:hypothetical protein